MTVTLSFWPGVGVAVATGVLSGIGSRALDAILGGAEQQVNLAEVIQSIIPQIRQVMNQVLRENDREKLDARAKTVQVLCQDYTNAPNEHLLNTLHHLTVDGISQAQRLKLYGISAYGIFGTLNLFVHGERFSATHAEGDRKNLARSAKTLVEAVPAFTKALQSDTEKRFSGVHEVGLGYRMYMDKDGHRPIHLSSGLDRGKALEKRAAYINEFYGKAERDLLGGLYQVRDVWVAIEEKYSDPA